MSYTRCDLVLYRRAMLLRIWGGGRGMGTHELILDCWVRICTYVSDNVKLTHQTMTDSSLLPPPSTHHPVQLINQQLVVWGFFFHTVSPTSPRIIFSFSSSGGLLYGTPTIVRCFLTKQREGNLNQTTVYILTVWTGVANATDRNEDKIEVGKLLEPVKWVYPL